MRTFTAALLLVLSLSSPLAASRADGVSGPGLPVGMARPLPEGDDSPGDDKKDDDEEDEEEYRPRGSRLVA